MSDAAETPISAPESTRETQEPKPREEEAPISPADAWARLLAAVARVPQDDVTRAISAVARASIRAEQTGPSAISPEWAGALAFLGDLQQLLNRLDQDQARNAAAVMGHLFARQPAPNGAHRG